MGKESRPIRARLEDIRKKRPRRVNLSPNYYITVDPTSRSDDFELVEVRSTEQAPYPKSFIHFYVRYDEAGNYIGLNQDEKDGSVLSIWRRTDEQTEYLVNYGLENADPTKGIVNSVVLRKGPEDNRGRANIQPLDWKDTLVNIALPGRININDTVQRLVFGMDLQTRNPLSDKDLMEQPLVSFGQQVTT